jgi:hypothetical protein
MLRGRCSCGISGLPTSSPALQSLLTPLFPLLTRNAPVSLFFPLLTQKQGSGGSPEVKEAKEVKEVENLAFLTPAFTTTSINIVGAPTFPFLHTSARLQERFASLLRRASRGDPFQPSTFNFEPLFSPNPNHSRTSKTFARKSNHSRTYAKTGGGGGACLLVRQVQLSARRHSRSCAREGVCHGGRSAEKKRDSSLRSE